MSALTASFLAQKHAAGSDYAQYLASDPSRAPQWQAIYDRVGLSDSQSELLAAFTREMKVICLSGTWCGDCVAQGPMFERIAEASDVIDLRWLDRDEHADLSEEVLINAGNRVPTLIFCAEDFELVSYLGDRTLTRYRAIAAQQVGASCQLPGAEVAGDELTGTLQEWLNEFERVQLLLRLSPRLRQKHGD